MYINIFTYIYIYIYSYRHKCVYKVTDTVKDVWTYAYLGR
jgi:hypothetical protein